MLGELAGGGNWRAEVQREVEEWTTPLAKVMADEVELVKDREGQVVEVRKVEEPRRGAYRLGSATDVEATYRVHGEDKVDFGYNVSVADTAQEVGEGHRRTGFIREISAATGAEPDVVGIPRLLRAQREHHGIVPSKLIYDQAAGAGKTIAAVEEASESETQLVVRVVELDKGSGRFIPTGFQLSEDGSTLRCPGVSRARLPIVVVRETGGPSVSLVLSATGARCGSSAGEKQRGRRVRESLPLVGWVLTGRTNRWSQQAVRRRPRVKKMAGKGSLLRGGEARS